jgi:hypothetical protein
MRENADRKENAKIHNQRFIAAVLTANLFGPSAFADDTPLIGQAEVAVIAKLRDPDSAQFRNVLVRHRTCKSGTCIDDPADPAGPAIVCGEVNGKNGFGGYAGFQPFIYWNGNLFMADFLKMAPIMWTDACGVPPN